MLDKIDGFIRIYNKIKYQTGIKSGITYVISHSYDKV